MKVMINQIDVRFNYKDIKELYQVIKISTNDKYFKYNAPILDSIRENKGIMSVVFEYGKSFFVLFNKKNNYLTELKAMVRKDSDRDKLSIIDVDIESLPESTLLQLLLNSLNYIDDNDFAFCNLTGRLFGYHKNWFQSLSDGEVMTFQCAEIKIDNDMNVLIKGHTFSSIRLKHKMKFKKSKYSDYPQYTFTYYKQTLRRVTKDEWGDNKNYIIKPVEKIKQIPFLEFKSKEKFSASKMGFLYMIIERVKEKYKSLITISFTEKIITERLEIPNAYKKQMETRLKEMIKGNKYCLVDKIKDSTSDIRINEILDNIKSLYPDISITVGKRLSKNKHNLVLIHNKLWYGGSDDDPYGYYSGSYIVQHITLEDFSQDSKSAVKNVIKELIIKEEIQNNRISLMNWGNLGYKDTFIFGTMKEEVYYFMKIYPDGRFELNNMKRDLFNRTEFDSYMDYFKITDERISGNQKPELLIKDDNGNINIIYQTQNIVIPQFHEVGEILEKVEDDFQILGSDLKELIENILIKENLNGTHREVIGNIENSISDTIFYSRKKIYELIENEEILSGKQKKLRVILNDYIFTEFNYILFAYLRSFEKKRQLFLGVTNINYYRQDEYTALFSVGEIENGMKDSIERGSVLRNVKAVEGELIFQKLLPLMNVEFVRMGRLTVMPYPLKYLREYLMDK